MLPTCFIWSHQQAVMISSQQAPMVTQSASEMGELLTAHMMIVAKLLRML
jgi:hypothetical protein